MKNYSFNKMNGAGNDFLIFDKRLNPGLAFTQKSIASLCDRRKGIGADGLMIYEPSEDGTFGLEFFNSDGLRGSLCGNGARCALEFHRQYYWKQDDPVRFRFNGKEYSGKIIREGLIRFHLAPPEKVKLGFKVKAGGQMITANYADTGSPHVVVETEQILRNPARPSDGAFAYPDELDVVLLGREIRHLKEFSPGGVNVNFISYRNGLIYIRTFERGVEDETLACGTGSVASALVVHLLHGAASPLTLRTRGGDSLEAGFEKSENGSFHAVYLQGPAEVNFTGLVSEKFFI
ncbi:MAG: diaminopimelate epimerase [Ignavibacteriales bacterium]|nr:MAG: diaminopimelate epimerase [Ignavibacteriales bacterium]